MALPTEITDKYDLILPGQSWSGSEAVFSYLSSLSLKQNIHFPGFVSNSTMEALYSHASLYVFPSYYEGFGLPLLEAMSYGVPVICSNTPSLVEVGGDAVELFEPDETKNITDKIIEVIGDDSLQESMVSKGYQRIKRFSWKQHAEALIRLVSK